MIQITPPSHIDLDLSEKQEDAFFDESPFLLYGGAKGGGKSWFLCCWMFVQAMKYPGNKLFFFRKRAVDFINTTLQTWKKCIPETTYRINEQKRVITVSVIKNTVPSEIFFGGLDDEIIVEKLNSFESGGGAIDQAEEIGRDAFGMCRGTLRHTLPNGKEPSFHIRLSANPAQCWLKDAFILSPLPGFKYVRALPTDNPRLPESYLNNLIQGYAHRPELQKAYVEGSWDGLSSHNAVISMEWIDQAKQQKPYGVVRKRIIANDPALFGDDENVIMVIEQTERFAYVTDTQILPKQGPGETASALAIARKKWGATEIFVDQIGVGEGIVDKLSEMGEPVYGVKGSQSPTIETEHKKYAKLKDQMWMEAGDMFANNKVCLSDDPYLTGQLSSITYKITAGGKYQVDTKKEIKDKLGRSPDRADCLVVGLYGLTQATDLREKDYLDNSTDRVSMGYNVSKSIDENYSPFPDEVMA